MSQHERNPVHSVVVGRRVFVTVAGLVLWLAAGGLVSAAEDLATAEPGRFGPPRRLVDGPADWVTFDTYRGVFGSGTSLTIVKQRATVSLESRLQLGTPVTHGLLVGHSLYLVEQLEDGERLGVLDLNAPDHGVVPVGLDPAPRGTLHLGRMDDYLLVAEDGLGLRILELPHPHNGDSSHAGSHGLRPVGLFPFAERMTAVTASLRTVYIATEQGLTVVGALVPALPSLVQQITLDVGVHAMAANGPKVYLLGADGLRVVDFNQAGGPAITGFDPEVRGSSLYFAGRTIYLAGAEGGLAAVEDTSARMVTIFITVGDIFFSPAGLVNVNQGDMVTWQKPGTVFSHNVFSCNPGQAGCGGATSTETFSSGVPTIAPFNFSHTFNLVGSNPYLCQAHIFSMVGNINVSAAVTPPPGVADGLVGTTPMTVDKLVPSGADLRIFYDPGACGADANDHNILFGTGALLPTVLGGVYGLSGSRCNIGLATPFDWIASPPVGSDFLWWVIVADDGAGKEGSWSEDSSGERTGPGLNGSSNQCGNPDKDLTNTCPP